MPDGNATGGDTWVDRHVDMISNNANDESEEKQHISIRTQITPLKGTHTRSIRSSINKTK